MSIGATMPSPLQNRVHPDGSVHAVAARGTMMGNRGGRLHDGDRRLGRRRWASKAWICCETAFRGRHRTVMGASYTELFFLDEATALAAGHRPCFECRRADARAFAEAFAGGDTQSKAAAMDMVLHAERLAPRPQARLADLPVGAMVADEGGPVLLAPGGLRRWSFDGYAPVAQTQELAALLTPPAIVEVLRAGYRPRLHQSA